MFDKIKNIYEAQKKLGEIKKGLEDILIDNETYGGKIKVSMNGTQKVISIKIDEELVCAGKREILQRVLVECINGAADKVQRLASQKLKDTMGDLKIPGL